MDDILLSLCIPTNGVVEWVKPVLDSIYLEMNPIGKFEVVVTDNGDNIEFKEMMEHYCDLYTNLIYERTTAIQFANQIEAFKLARGKFIKFVNHRMTLVPGALNYLIQFVINNEKEKPFVYFLDNECAGIYSDFDEYVKGLSYWSSYSGGTAMWKADFNTMDLTKPFNKLFPHIDMIFSIKDKDKYIVDGQKLMESLPTDDTKKGNYNLFRAFADEYPSVILELYRNGYISLDTFLSVKEDTFSFIKNLYFDYVIRKKPCSYELKDSDKHISVYYSLFALRIGLIGEAVKKLVKKLKH